MTSTKIFQCLSGAMHRNRQSRRWREWPRCVFASDVVQSSWKKRREKSPYGSKGLDSNGDWNEPTQTEKDYGNGSNMAAIWNFSIPVSVSDFLMLWCKSWHFFCILTSLERLSTAAGNKGVILGFYLDMKRRWEKSEWLQRAVSWEVIKWKLNVLDSLTRHITDGLSDSFYCLSLK